MKQPELSIIIPIHNAYTFFEKCMASLYKIEGVDYEIICVNDGSTDPNIVTYLNKLSNINVIHTNGSSGFNNACKLGADDAIGKYLLFLNTDTELIEPKSFRYMLDCLKNKKDVGIVGAKLLLDNNTIQHAGLVFDRGSMNFQHRLYGVDQKDPRVMVSEVVEAVTGACYLVSKELWVQLKGWDSAFSPSYFEDTDFCLRAKEIGKKSYYCAEAVLKHYQTKSHGKDSMDKTLIKNHEIFKERWIRTSKITEYPKIAACYIVFEGDGFLEYSLKSIYDMVDKIIIVEGSTEQTRKFAKEDGSSSDKTVEIIKNFNDPDSKIRLIQGKWKDKTEMRNIYCQHLDTMDYAWVIDGDEVWDKETLKKIEHMIFARPEIPSFQFNFYDFWHDMGYRSRGIWEQFTGRISLINLNLTGDIKYDIHTLPKRLDGKNISSVYCSDLHFYHYSYIDYPKGRIKKKIDYYINTPSEFYEVV